ncbi:hypothetical protein QUH01_29140, partial [Klebsiella michiganensis]|uniref:hypothetical protein n=1 Tax=Klebsiella michiganensis TaxID=1134687 RepID=UPI0025A07316
IQVTGQGTRALNSAYAGLEGARPQADIILSLVDTLFSFALRTVMSKVSPKMFPAVNGLLVLPAARG